MAIVAAICLGVLGSLIAYGLVQAYKGYEDNEDVLGLLRRLSQKFPKRVKRKAHSQYRYIVYLREPYEDNFAEVTLPKCERSSCGK